MASLPGAALRPVDGATPRVGQVRRPILAAALNEARRQGPLYAGAVDFDVPVLYFLTPPPTGLWVHVPGSRIDTLTRLEAVLGRPDNLSEWETILDEWSFTPNDELPFPLSQQKRDSIRAVAAEVALIRAHHLIRKHFKGDLDELRETLASLANLVLDVQQHEALATLDEDEHMRRLEAMRADVAKGSRLADANEQFFQESVAAHEAAQQKPAKKK